MMGSLQSWSGLVIVFFQVQDQTSKHYLNIYKTKRTHICHAQQWPTNTKSLCLFTNSFPNLAFLGLFETYKSYLSPGFFILWMHPVFSYMSVCVFYILQNLYECCKIGIWDIKCAQYITQWFHFSQWHFTSFINLALDCQVQVNLKISSPRSWSTWCRITSR